MPGRRTTVRGLPIVGWRKQELRERFYPADFRGMYDRFSDVVHQYVRAGDLMLDAGWRGVEAGDIFPTVYRANTDRRLRSLYENAGIDVEALDQFETEPEYLAFSTLTYMLGVAYERMVNRFGALRRLRVNLLAVGRKR